jgi:predicted HAD superfamily Cof-like phosphohydrolase
VTTQSKPDYTVSHQANVAEFHERFGVRNGVAPSNTLLTDEDTLLRVRLLVEEFAEYINAVLDGDLVEIADGLTDIDYILNGTSAMHGFNIDDLHEEVHASNMSKLGADGEPIFREDGKVLKSDQYFRPDIRGELSATGLIPELTPLAGEPREEIARILLTALGDITLKAASDKVRLEAIDFFHGPKV